MVADTLLLCGFAFIAGLIDSIAGGGGLIQLPALFVFFPSVPVAQLLGTNKLAAISGTSVASLQYMRRVSIRWKATLPAIIFAFVFSFLGARTVSLIRPGTLRPVVPLILAAILVYTLLNKNLGSTHTPRLKGGKELFFGVAVGTAIGFYDGFFGPGTGSFLIFAFVGIFGFNFLSASASSKLVNFSTNLAALLYFTATGNVLYHLALPMAVSNILGSVLGTRLAVLKGSGFVRIFFILVVSAMIVKLAVDAVARL